MNYYDLTDYTAGEEMSPLRFTEQEEDLDILESRMGRITGSEFGKLIVRTKDRKGFTLSSSKSAERIIYRTVWERLIDRAQITNGIHRINFNSAATNHGHDHEQEAILLYMERTGNKVDYVQKFIEHDEYIGGTPDGYIGEEGLIEVKCPWDGGNHIISLDKQVAYNDEHLFQIQGYLWLTGRLWCDLVIYDPVLSPAFQLNVIRIERDEVIIEAIQEVLERVKAKVIEIENRFKAQT